MMDVYLVYVNGDLDAIYSNKLDAIKHAKLVKSARIDHWIVNSKLGN